MKRLSLFAAISLTLLSACASPEVISTKKISDEKMTCEQIKQEISIANESEQNARKEKGVTGTNVAAALLFWPALLVTNNNANEAIDAAKDREAYLLELASKKRCK